MEVVLETSSGVSVLGRVDRIELAEETWTIIFDDGSAQIVNVDDVADVRW